MLAYLDPASGSMILSAVVGGVAGVGVFAKQARAKLSRKRPAAATAETSEAPTAGEGDEPATLPSDA